MSSEASVLINGTHEAFNSRKWDPVLQGSDDVCKRIRTLKEVASNLLCPLNLTLMVEPLLAEDGHTYEKSAIVDWLTRSDMSPKDASVCIHNSRFFKTMQS